MDIVSPRANPDDSILPRAAGSHHRAWVGFCVDACILEWCATGMSLPGTWWYHVTINTVGSWLPGDPRGFRSRGHRIHSSGDYKSPPPPGEHEGLFAYSKRICPNAVTILASARGSAGGAIVRKLEEQQRRLLAVSVGGHHAHLLAELPREEQERWDVLRDCKRASSHVVRKELSGRVWGGRGKLIAVKDRAHHQRVYEYILRHASERAWVWSFRDGVVFDPAER